MALVKVVGADRLEDLAEDYVASLETFIHDIHSEVEKAASGIGEYSPEFLTANERLVRLLNWVEEENPLYGGTRIRYPKGGF